MWVEVIDNDIDAMDRLANTYDQLAARPYQTSGEVHRLRQLAAMHRAARDKLLQMNHRPTVERHLLA